MEDEDIYKNYEDVHKEEISEDEKKRKEKYIKYMRAFAEGKFYDPKWLETEGDNYNKANIWFIGEVDKLDNFRRNENEMIMNKINEYYKEAKKLQRHMDWAREYIKISPDGWKFMFLVEALKSEIGGLLNENEQEELHKMRIKEEKNENLAFKGGGFGSLIYNKTRLEDHEKQFKLLENALKNHRLLALEEISKIA